MRKITKEELNTAIESHALWLNSNKSAGKRADLDWVNLAGADLTSVDLAGADLTGAILTGAKLTDAIRDEVAK